MMTDLEIESCFGGGKLSDSNGQHCNRILMHSCGVERERTRVRCSGRAIVEGGKVKLRDTCGEPCSFVCEEAKAFRQAVEALLIYEAIIGEAKSHD